MEQLLVLANVVLVLITAWYAWQTHQTVVEMRESRRAAVRPHICLDLEDFGAGILAKVVNVGAGAALDVTTTLELHQADELVETLEWATPVLRSGESRLLHMPKGNGASVQSASALRDARTVMRLSGSCSSATGETITAADAIDFAASMRNEVTVTSSTDISERLKKIVDSLKGIERAIQSCG